jgi:hypothetical protein
MQGIRNILKGKEGGQKMKDTLRKQGRQNKQGEHAEGEKEQIWEQSILNIM